MNREQFKQEILPLRRQLLLYSRNFFEDPEEAEDIVQEVFMKLWDIREKLINYDSVKALSIQITKNLCLNRIKVLQRKVEDSGYFSFVSETLTPEDQLEMKDNVLHVMKIIDRLPGLQQAILRMRHIDELEIEEIAEITGNKPEAIRMNLSRARKKVKELFFKM